MSIKELMHEMVKRNASDLFYRAGGSARLRVDGKLLIIDEKVLTIDDVIKAAEEITTLKQREFFKDNLWLNNLRDEKQQKNCKEREIFVQSHQKQ